ncbi:zinc finger protein 37-like isoform X2 [Planococcus citri]
MITVDTILKDFHDLSNLENLCRMCGKNQSSFTPIFDETNRYNYYRVIQQHFRDDLPVSKTDILPLKMCAKCLKLMMSWHEFYLECMKVEKKFKRLIDKFSLTQDPEKRIPAIVNDVEVIEVSVDDETYDFFNENTGEFDISNVNIKESTSFVDTNDLSHFDDLNDSSSSGHENNENKTTKTAETTETTETTDNHSESRATKNEEPKKKNINKGQSISLGKRSTASKGHDEGGSSAAKRARSNSKAVGGVGGSSDHPEQSVVTKKPSAIGKTRNLTTKTSSVANKAVKISIGSIKPSKKPIKKSNTVITSAENASKPSVKPVEITLDDEDDDDVQVLKNKREPVPKDKQEDKNSDQVDNNRANDDDDDDDSLFQLECEVQIHSPSPKPNDTRNADEDGEGDGNETATNKEKKKLIRPPKMCEVCGKVVSAKLFKEHMIMHNDPESMTCSCCDKLFSTVSSLKKHFIWTHTSLRPFMCDLCGSTFKRNDHLKLHREHFHANENSGGTAVKCSICGASVQTIVSLQSHMKRVHGQTKIESYDKDLNHKILADKTYECGICGLNFKQFSYLRIHIKFVHEKGLPWHINQGASGPYKCDPCNSTYATLQSLREHNRRRHDGAPVEKFHKQCSHCGMLYRNRLHYSKHLAKISGRPTCYVCWKDFDSADDLKVHINSDHLDELPFGCELCGVRFVYLTELRNHMYTHSKTKEFKCDECGHSFVRKDFLKSHQRRHKGIRNHTCEECNKSFVEFCDLRKHMQTHSKNKSFVPVKEENEVLIAS